MMAPEPGGDRAADDGGYVRVYVVVQGKHHPLGRHQVLGPSGRRCPDGLFAPDGRDGRPHVEGVGYGRQRRLGGVAVHQVVKTRSPSLTWVTSRPLATTTPVDSCPSSAGSLERCSSGERWIWWSWEWQMPLA